MAAPGEDCHCSYFQSFTWGEYSLPFCPAMVDISVLLIITHSPASILDINESAIETKYSDILPMILEIE